MYKLKKHIAIISLNLMAAVVYAAPAVSKITIDNQCDLEARAYIASLPTPTPSAPGKITSISWPAVLSACSGHTSNNICPATIKLATNTSQPFLLGDVSINIKTGVITPSTLSSQGYTMNVVGLGSVRLSKD